MHEYQQHIESNAIIGNSCVVSACARIPSHPSIPARRHTNSSAARAGAQVQATAVALIPAIINRLVAEGW